VASLVVTRNDGLHVASVSQFDAAKALVDLANLKVQGDVSGHTGERGFLELTWNYPSQTQEGKYICEINTLNDAGHGVVFSRELDIESNTPTINQVANYIRDLQVKTNDLQQENIELRQENLDLRREIHILKTNTTQKIDQLVILINQPKHIEHGVINCGDSRQYTQTLPSDSSVGYKDVHLTFQKSFDHPPVVHVGGPADFNNYGGHNTYFDVKLLSVDKDGFSVRCQAMKNCCVIMGLTRNWIGL
jgi:hypothetical protein